MGELQISCLEDAGGENRSLQETLLRGGVQDLLWTHHSMAEAVTLGIYSRVRRHGAESRSKGRREAFEGQLSHSSCIPQPPRTIYLLSLRTAGACRERISLIPYWFQLNTTISRKLLVLSREKAWVT